MIADAIPLARMPGSHYFLEARAGKDDGFVSSAIVHEAKDGRKDF